jgi:hypothetical protein
VSSWSTSQHFFLEVNPHPGVPLLCLSHGVWSCTPASASARRADDPITLPPPAQLPLLDCTSQSTVAPHAVCTCADTVLWHLLMFYGRTGLNRLYVTCMSVHSGTPDYRGQLLLFSCQSILRLSGPAAVVTGGLEVDNWRCAPRRASTTQTLSGVPATSWRIPGHARFALNAVCRSTSPRCHSGGCRPPPAQRTICAKAPLVRAAREKRCTKTPAA